MISSYYLWKWADNDLAGRPTEVFAELTRGRIHPGLEPFDAKPLLHDLQAMAARRHPSGEEWEWQACPSDSPDRVSFVFLQCPKIPKYGELREQFVDLMYPHRISGFCEEQGSLIECLLPKLNSFAFGESPNEDLFDIVENDIPVLLGRLHPNQANPYAVLTNHVNHFVQCLVHTNGYHVEWRENRSLTDFTDYDHWRAGNERQQNTQSESGTVCETRYIHSELRTVKLHEFQHERLRFGDAVHIFQAFLRGDPRPSEYHWRSIRSEFEQSAQKERKVVSHD